MKKIIGLFFGLVIGCFGLVFSACDPNYDNLSIEAYQSNAGGGESEKLQSLQLAVGETADFNFKIENAPNNYNFQVTLNQVNNLFTVVSSKFINGKLNYSIKGVNPGKTTVEAVTYEGGKSCSFEVEVFENVTNFAVNGTPFAVVEKDASYVLKNQSYFTFAPQNCKVPEILFTYEDEEVTEIKAVENGGKISLKLVKADGTYIDKNFTYGKINLQAQILKYGTKTPAEIASIDLDVQIVPPIDADLENIQILQRGGLSSITLTGTFLDKTTGIKLIQNQIDDCYMLFEVKCKTPDVVLTVSSTLCECTQVTLAEVQEMLPTYTQPSGYQYCKFFAVQAVNVGTGNINLKLAYSQATSYSQTDYNLQTSFKVEVITAPYKVIVNDLASIDEEITLFDSAKNPTHFAVTVLDILSNFESITVSLTEYEGGSYVENKDLYDYVQLTYKTKVDRTDNFEIDYKDFVTNSLTYPIKIKANKLYKDTFYLSIKVNLLEGFNAEDKVVEINVPLKIEEGIHTFDLQDEYQNEDITTSMSRILYMDVDVESYTFDGFVIENLKTALLSEFVIEYENNSDEIFEVKQIYEEEERTATLSIKPKAIGQGIVKITAQEGFSRELQFCVCKSLTDANLVLVQNKDVTKTTLDGKGNITSFEFAFDEESYIYLSVILGNNDANLYSINAGVDKSGIVDVISQKKCEIGLKISDVTDEDVILTVNVYKLSIDTNFVRSTINDANKIQFQVAINSYSPIKNICFQQKTEKGIYTTISGLSLFRAVDVGYMYAESMAKSNVKLVVTLKNGTQLDYEDFKTNSMSLSTTYGSVVVNGKSEYSISSFGTLKINEDEFVLICDNSTAKIGTFLFAISLVDHDVTFTTQLSITVKKFTALEYIGISNFQETLYLSGKQDSYTFYTFVDPNADIPKFDVVYDSDNIAYKNLFTTTVNGTTEVIISHNKLVPNGWGYLYFVPKTSFDESGSFPHDRVQKIKVVYSDGTDKNYPELLSDAKEFMSAMTSSDPISKHYLILSTIDLKDYSYSDFAKIKALTGSISGGNANAKIININLDITDENYKNINVGLFPKIAETGEINDIAFEGKLNIDLENIGTDKNFAIGLIAGQNLGKLNNVSVILQESNITLQEGTSTSTNNYVYVGGVVGINNGQINNGINAIGDKKTENPVIFNFDDKKINLTTINASEGFNLTYSMKGTDSAFGGIAGKNIGAINRDNSGVGIFNNNNYTVIIDADVSGFNATGGVAGYNGGIGNSSSNIVGQCVSGKITAYSVDKRGGENCGGIAGSNYAGIKNCTVRATISAYDYVGGIVGLDKYPDEVENNLVQAVKNTSYAPMLTAISSAGHIDAICGHSEKTVDYSLQGNIAKVYYTVDEMNKIPIRYYQDSNIFVKAKNGVFVESKDSLSVSEINVVKGTQKFDNVTGIDEKKIANMFIYQASDTKLQKYIDYKNKNREIPFIFDSQSTIIIDSLSPEILNVNSAGSITLNSPGLAKLKITSVLDTTITDYLYVYVSNAFSDLIVESSDGTSMPTNAFLNVYGDTTSKVQTRFAQTLTVKGDYDKNIDVQLVDAYIPTVAVEFIIDEEDPHEPYTQYSQYGNLIIFSSKSNTIQTGVDEVKLSTTYTLNLMIDGVNVLAQITNFDFMTAKDFDVLVRSLTGTKTINADISTADIQPVDEITINITQITDDDEDKLDFSNVKFVKLSDKTTDGKEYFKEVLVQSTQTEITNESSEVIEYKNEYKFILKYNFEDFGENYEGQYYIVFVANNGKSTTVLVNLKTQQLENIELKNYYDVKDEYNPATLQKNQVSSGVNSVLEVNIYPYFSDYDYVVIKNDESNAQKNNIIIMELAELSEDDGKTLNFAEGAIYEDGIIISKEIITDKNRSFIDIETGIAKLLIKYTTISKATVDSIAKINVIAYKNNEIVMQQTADINIVAVDSVYFTIDGREEAEVYYLAKGLTYDLTLNLYGFTENQVQIEVYHNNFPTNKVSITQVNNKYQLKVSDNINYDADDEGFSVVVQTYGRNIIDGKEYRSGISKMNIVVVDFVVLSQNMSTYNHNEDITKFNKQTSISLAQGAVVSLPVGSNYEIKNQFVYGTTVEYDQTNDEIANKVKSFEQELTENGTWSITANDVTLGVLDKFKTSSTIDGKTNISTNYLKLQGRTLTPLKVNDYTNTNYYLSYTGQYKYLGGIPQYTKSGANIFDLTTDFVLDVYPNSTLDNAIPVYSYDELCGMQANAHYILMKDITLSTDFTPISTEIASLDGNGYSIILPSYLYFSEGNNFGLFSTVSENTILKNITIKVNTKIVVTILVENNINFGILTGENKGIITNCCVEGITSTQISVTIPNQSADTGLTNNYVCGLVALNNGYITNSHVSVNLSAVANVSGFVGINNNKISSSYVRDSMIVNKSGSNFNHKTAGFAIKNGSSVSSSASISSCYVCGETNKEEIYSTSITKALSSMPSVAGFVYSNYSAIQDCYSDIVITSSSYCSGFVFENAGNIKRSYSTSTFTDFGVENYAFVVSNKINTSSVGTFESCSYLVGSVNASTSKQLLTGLQGLDDNQFMDSKNFADYSISSNISKTDAVWFYPSLSEELVFKKKGNNMSFTYGKPELVAPNLLVYSQKELDVANTVINDETGETVYAYIEKLNPVGSYLNPIVISSAQTFENYILGNSFGNLNSLNYRIVADIDYKTGNLLSTTYNTILTGSIEGNNMTISGYTINSRAMAANGGLLAQIGQGNSNVGVVKNLNLKPYYINLPNTNCVGALAGRLEGGKIYNITANGFGYDYSNGMKILGKNAVGGVIGFATNGFVIKNISSSISANATYDHSKSENNFVLYQSSTNLAYVSYVGTIIGIATKNGTIQNISATNKCYVIGEVAGLLAGKIGTNVKMENVTQIVEGGQRIIATVYGGGLVGELNGTIENANISGEADNNFFKKVDTQTMNATAVGGITGVCACGKITSSDVNINLIWDYYAPSIVGGVVGEMLGGTLNSVNFTGDNITINCANTDLSLTEFTAGGIVGKISSELSLITDSKVSASDVTIELCSTTGLMTVNLITVMKSYVGGIIGQVVHSYLNEDTQEQIISGKDYYLSKSHYQYILNGVKNEMDISTYYLIYGGVLTRYINGLVGAVFSDSTKLYAGEIIVYGKDDADNKTKFASSSNCDIIWTVKDSKNTAQIVPLINLDACNDLRLGFFVNEQTEISSERNYNSKTNPWGKVLQTSSKSISYPLFEGNITKK